MYILGGTWKGRRILSPPESASTRPITSLVKKSLFDILSPRLEAAVVADLYCGAGTMGLEALSRGAAKCYFAERDRGALRNLRRNIDDVGAADRCIVWAGDLTERLVKWLAAAEPLDVVLVDPPYADSQYWSWGQADGTIFTPLGGHLGPDGVLALRLPSRADAPDRLGGLAVQRVREYGDMKVLFLGREGEGVRS